MEKKVLYTTRYKPRQNETGIIIKVQNMNSRLKRD